MKQSYPTLSSARESLGLTTDQVAARIGVAQSTIVRLEQSEKRKSISLNILERTARALGLKFEYQFILDQSVSRPLNEFERMKNLSVEEKLLKAIELSELTRKLKNASKSPR